MESQEIVSLLLIGGGSFLLFTFFLFSLPETKPSFSSLMKQMPNGLVLVSIGLVLWWLLILAPHHFSLGWGLFVGMVIGLLTPPLILFIPHAPNFIRQGWTPGIWGSPMSFFQALSLYLVISLLYLRYRGWLILPLGALMGFFSLLSLLK